MPRTTAPVRALVTGVVLAATLAACAADEPAPPAGGPDGGVVDDGPTAECRVTNELDEEAADAEVLADAMCEVDTVAAVVLLPIEEGVTYTQVRSDTFTADHLLDVTGIWSEHGGLGDVSIMEIREAPEGGVQEPTAIVQVTGMPEPLERGVAEAFVELGATADRTRLEIMADLIVADADLLVEHGDPWHTRLVETQSLLTELNELAADGGDPGWGGIRAVYPDREHVAIPDSLDGLVDDPRWGAVIDQVHRAETASTTGEPFGLCLLRATDAGVEVECGASHGREVTDAEQIELDVLRELVTDVGGIYTERD